MGSTISYEISEVMNYHSMFGCIYLSVPAGVDDHVALVTPGELPELHAPGRAVAAPPGSGPSVVGLGSGPGEGPGRGRPAAPGLAAEKAGLLAQRAALGGRVVGSVDDTGVAVNNVAEAADGAAGGAEPARRLAGGPGGVVDAAALDLLAGEEVLELVPRGGLLGRLGLGLGLRLLRHLGLPLLAALLALQVAGGSGSGFLWEDSEESHEKEREEVEERNGDEAMIKRSSFFH